MIVGRRRREVTSGERVFRVGALSWDDFNCTRVEFELVVFFRASKVTFHGCEPGGGTLADFHVSRSDSFHVLYATIRCTVMEREFFTSRDELAARAAEASRC